MRFFTALGIIVTAASLGLATLIALGWAFDRWSIWRTRRHWERRQAAIMGQVLERLSDEGAEILLMERTTP